MNSKLENDLNHYLIILYFTLDMILQNLKQQHSWKRMNKEDIVASTQYLHMPGLLNTISKIEEYTNYLMNFLQQLIELIVSLVKSEQRYICS